MGKNAEIRILNKVVNMVTAVLLKGYLIYAIL
jgi:hypothetical protein